jgi:hypothetical protein
MRDADGLDAERSGVDDVPGHDRPQLDVLDPELLELVGDEPERQRHAVNRQRQPLDEKRHRADVIFVPVREKQRADLRRVVEEIRHVRDDDVDAERGRVGKHHPAVDEDGVVTILVDHEVHADLAETAEGDDAQRGHG